MRLLEDEDLLESIKKALTEGSPASQGEACQTFLSWRTMSQYNLFSVFHFQGTGLLTGVLVRYFQNISELDV